MTNSKLLSPDKMYQTVPGFDSVTPNNVENHFSTSLPISVTNEEVVKLLVATQGGSLGAKNLLDLLFEPSYTGGQAPKAHTTNLLAADFSSPKILEGGIMSLMIS